MIRKATPQDIPAVAAIYDHIHTREERGEMTTGWLRNVYPTRATAEEALLAGELYVAQEGQDIVAGARINQIQPPAYAQAPWRYPAAADEVLVLHTLVVEPALGGRGLGRRFVGFYEDLARSLGCWELRIDTNQRNAAARRLYTRLGYAEVGIVPCDFNGIPGVGLVCLEKRLELQP